MSAARRRGPLLDLAARLARVAILRAREWRMYGYAALGAPPPRVVRVVLFAQGRTGSTLLESLLASTGLFRANGELLNTHGGWCEILAPHRLLRGMLVREPRPGFVFHVKIYHLGDDRRRPLDPAAFLRRLRREGWSVIYLRREDPVRHTLSNLVAEARGSHHKFDDEREDLRLQVDCGELERRVRYRIATLRAERRALDGLDHLEVVYERDLEDPSRHQPTVDRIFDHLGLPRRRVGTRHRKVNTAGVAELIANHAEFRACLERNGWGRYARDEPRGGSR